MQNFGLFFMFCCGLVVGIAFAPERPVNVTLTMSSASDGIKLPVSAPEDKQLPTLEVR